MEREQGELIKPVRVNVTSICPLEFPPGYLALLVSQKEVDRYPEIESGIVASNVRGNGLDFYAELKDGSRHPIGKPRLHVLKS